MKNKWTKSCCTHIHSGIWYNRKENLKFAVHGSLDDTEGCHVEQNTSEKSKYWTISFICGIERRKSRVWVVPIENKPWALYDRAKNVSVGAGWYWIKWRITLVRVMGTLGVNLLGKKQYMLKPKLSVNNSEITTGEWRLRLKGHKVESHECFGDVLINFISINFSH